MSLVLALCVPVGVSAQSHPQPKERYSYAFETPSGQLTLDLALPAVMPTDIQDGFSAMAQPVFVTLRLGQDMSQTPAQHVLPLSAGDALAERFRNKTSAAFVEALARKVLATSICYGGEVGLQHPLGAYRMRVLKAQAIESARRTGGSLHAAQIGGGAETAPVRFVTLSDDHVIWRADLTCSYWRNPAAYLQLERQRDGVDPRGDRQLEKIRAHRVWETATYHSFGRLPNRPAPNPGPRWANPDTLNAFVVTLPGVPREPGLLRARP